LSRGGFESSAARSAAPRPDRSSAARSARTSLWRYDMSVAKVIEISSQSPENFEDAIQRGIQRATETVDDVKGVWIKEMNVDIENGKVSAYRVDMKVTFLLKK
jgi:hypothetical protein